jgi:hypothetical protein
MLTNSYQLGKGFNYGHLHFLVDQGRACELCAKPYPGRPRGCPNLNKKPGCPPISTPLQRVIDIEHGDTLIVFNVFNLRLWRKRMHRMHPEWTERQCLNPYYWQAHARKQLRHYIAHVVAGYQLRKVRRSLVVIETPEAYGIDVTKTLLEATGQRLQWPARDYAIQVALIGRKRKAV